MNKTNRFTLIATVLLGVLLYMILRFAADLNVAWDGSMREPPPATAGLETPQVPRIASPADLRALLDARGIDSAAALDGYTDWSEARGFTGANRLFGTLVNTTPADTLATEDDTGLRGLVDAGDAAATQLLAERQIFSDPFGAIALFRRAAEQGSTFALLRIASLLVALEAAEINHEVKDPEQRRRLAEITEHGVDNSLRLTAFGYVVAALRDGGLPIADPGLSTWLNQLDDIPNEELVAVCAWSERKLFEIARNRARNGKPSVTTDPPPVFLTSPGIADRLPCNHTAYPVENLLELERCRVTRIRDSADEPLDLHICAPG